LREGEEYFLAHLWDRQTGTGPGVDNSMKEGIMKVKIFSVLLLLSALLFVAALVSAFAP
jgi:hypothetical protein